MTFSQEKVDELYSRRNKLEEQIEEIDAEISAEYAKRPAKSGPLTIVDKILQEVYEPVLRRMIDDGYTLSTAVDVAMPKRDEATKTIKIPIRRRR